MKTEDVVQLSISLVMVTFMGGLLIGDCVGIDRGLKMYARQVCAPACHGEGAEADVNKVEGKFECTCVPLTPAPHPPKGK